MKLSVIIPCYNAADTLGEQLYALSKQQWAEPWEVVVVDNGCTDGSMKIVRQYKNNIPNLTIVSAAEKSGAGFARNIGVEHCRGEYIAFCDADDVVAKNWISSVGYALKDHDFIACSMEWKKLNHLSAAMLKAKKQKNSLMEFSITSFLPHAGGGTLAIKKSLHKKIGGFDESLKYLEDTDYCWRVQLTGEELVLAPEAKIHIRERGNRIDRFKQQMYWAEYSLLLYERYHDLGLEEYSNKRILRSFYGIIKNIPRLLHKSKRDNWWLRSGVIIGRMKGMIKYRLLHQRVNFIKRAPEVGEDGDDVVNVAEDNVHVG